MKGSDNILILRYRVVSARTAGSLAIKEARYFAKGERDLTDHQDVQEKMKMLGDHRSNQQCACGDSEYYCIDLLQQVVGITRQRGIFL